MVLDRNMKIGLLTASVFAMAFFAFKKAVDSSEALPSFEKMVLHDVFVSEGAAVADVNRDGIKDVLAGQYWFEGPDWTKHAITPLKEFDYTTGYSDSFLNFSADVNGDGWADLIRYGFPGKEVVWYENPQGADKHWEEHHIDSLACNESPMMVDLYNDGVLDLVYGHEDTGEMMSARFPTHGETTLQIKPLGAKALPGSKRFSHGLGFGDVNGDGRKDVLITDGWWEAPLQPSQKVWTFHPANLGEACSQMHTYDFDNDGDADVITASAHKYGVWWFEQSQEGGEIIFTRHLIDSSFSQTHGTELIDMNGDGLPDLVTGKRYFAHQGKDPGGMEAPVLYWFELSRDADGKPHWMKHLIDDDSGVGLQVVVEDMNSDDKLDIVFSNKKGVHCFMQE
ncbi:MAG: VCBS repeat-containing protein [Saprospiraceae bacterium]|nr:VCBS repeat-containing protein [Saprospiraceae bacterium]